MKNILCVLILSAGTLSAQFTRPLYPVNATSGTLPEHAGLAENRSLAMRSWDSKVAFLTDEIATLSTSSSGQPTVLYIGDSWSFLAEELKNALQSGNYGNGGFGFARLGPSDFPGYFTGSVTQTGAWSNLYDQYGTTAFGPGGVTTSSSDSTTPANVNVAFPVTQQYIKILYTNAASGGSFRYRINAGAWTVQSTAGTAGTLGTVSIATGSSAITTMDVQMVSGTVNFAGFASATGTAAPTLHNIGRAGAKASDFASMNATLWQSEIAVLNPDIAIIQFGVNELLGNVSPASQLASMGTLISELRAVRPDIGIVLMPPAQIDVAAVNAGGYVMADYVNAQATYARANGYGFFCMYKMVTPFNDANASARASWTNFDHITPRMARTVASSLASWMMIGARH